MKLIMSVSTPYSRVQKRYAQTREREDIRCHDAVEAIRPSILFYCVIIKSCHHPSFLHLSRRCFLALGSPPCLLVTSSPLLLHIAQSLLDLVHGVRVAGVLSNVVADLDGGTAGGGGEFDDDVEWCGLFAGGKMGEIIWDRLDGS